MTVETWKWIAEKLGIPMVFVAVLCLAIYNTGKWTANHVFDPLVTKHIEFLETEQQNMRSIAKDVGAQSVEISRIADESKQQTQVLKSIRDDQRKFPAVSEKMP